MNFSGFEFRTVHFNVQGFQYKNKRIDLLSAYSMVRLHGCTDRPGYKGLSIPVLAGLGLR
jgi:hypothetical protein